MLKRTYKYFFLEIIENEYNSKLKLNQLQEGRCVTSWVVFNATGNPVAKYGS